MRDLNRHVYLYAQSLSNNGDFDLLCAAHDNSCAADVASSSTQREKVRRYHDVLMSVGRILYLGSSSIECRISLSGTCVAVIRPVTLDRSGRISPVLVLFNMFSRRRKSVVRILRSIPDKMGRELDDQCLKGIEELESFLRYPLLFLFIRIIFLPKGSGDD